MSKHELPAKTVDVTAELNVTDQLIHLLLQVVNDCVTYSLCFTHIIQYKLKILSFCLFALFIR